MREGQLVNAVVSATPHRTVTCMDHHEASTRLVQDEKGFVGGLRPRVITKEPGQAINQFAWCLGIHTLMQYFLCLITNAQIQYVLYFYTFINMNL